MAKFVFLLTFQFKFDNGREEVGEVKYPTDKPELSDDEMDRIKGAVEKLAQKKSGGEELAQPPVLINSIRLTKE